MSDIIVGSVGVRLVPNAEGFSAKAKALTQGLTANVKADLDDKEAKAKVEDLGRPRKAKVKAEADTAEASARLDYAARTRRAKIEADVSGLDRVTAALDRVPKGMGLLGTSIAAFGPALIPVTAAVGGLTAALAAPIAAGVGGLGLYGFIAGKAVKDTEKQSKAIDQLKKKVDAAQVSLAKASTPAGKKSALATLAVDTKAYNDALGKLSPAQAGFIRAQGQVVTAFHSLENTAGPSIFGPLTSAMTTLSTLMPKVAPVLKPVSAALKGLLDEVAKSARSGALDDFMKFLAATSGPTITTAGHILGNVALGFAAIGKAFAPLGASLGDAVLHWSQSFAKIGQSKGLADFVGYVRKEGPQVASTLGHVAGAIGHIATALAPLGDLSLKGLDGLAKGVSKIPTGVLSAAAISFASIALSMKAIAVAKGGLSALSTVAKFAGIGGKGGGGLATVEGALGKVGAKGVVPVFVTNEGFGKPGGGILGGPAGKAAGAAGGAAAAEAGSAGLLSRIFSRTKGLLGKGLGAGGLLEAFALGGFGSQPDVLPSKSLGPKAFSSMLAAAGAKKAADATREWAKAQAGLNTLLLGPALPKYAAQLQTLPKKVQTQIATPGAVTSLSDVSRLAKQYHLTPKQVRTLIELANAGKVKADAAAIGRLYGLTPKQVRTLISQAGMDSSQAQIRRLASLYHLTPKQVRTIVTADTSNAAGAIARIRSMLAGIPRSISTSYYVNQVNSVSKAPLNLSPGHGSALGSTVPKDGGPYADRFPYLLAPGEEVISNRHGQADKHRGLLKAINAGMLAGGGTAGGWPAGGAFAHGWSTQKPPPWFAQFLLMAQGFAGGKGGASVNPLGAAIHDLNAAIKANTHELNATGKDKPTKAERKALEARQKALQKRLDALTTFRQATHDFNPASALPQKDPRNPIYANVRGQVNAFEAAVLKAGGTWTKAMERHATKLERDALALDRANRKQESLTNGLDTLKQSLSDLRSTMASYSSSVSGNFLSNPFGLGGQSSTFQPTVDNSPALSAATDQLNAAKAHLALLNSNDGTTAQRLANAYAAQGVAGDVAKLQAQVDQLSQPVTTTTDALSAFRDTLKADTQRALDFNSALTTLSKEGLNTDLFSQLAASGDVGFAQELAAAGQSAVDDINTLWNTRATAAAQVAALATQTVYGQQQAILQGQIKRQNDLIAKNTDTINDLSAAVKTLGNRVENGAEKGVAGLKTQLDALQRSVDAIPRQTKHATR